MTLPRGWVERTIGEIADTKLGKMLDGTKNKGKPVAYLRNVNVRWGSFDLSDLLEMRVTDDERETLSVRDGDLFMCEGGEPGRCAVWRGGQRDLVFQKAIHRVRPLDAIEPDYLASHIAHVAAEQRLAHLFTGTTIKHLPQVALQRIEVPLPPAAEQRRIVAKLDALTARLARARAELDRVPVLAGKLRLAILEETFGGLVQAQRVSISSICKVGTGSTPKRGEPRFYAGGDVPWVTSGSVNFGTVSEPTELITSVALRETNCKVFPAGSILVALYGEGKTRGMVATLGIAAATNQALAVLHAFDAGVRPDWVRHFLQARYEETRASAAGGVQPNLNLGIVKAIELSLPSLAEQDAAIHSIDAAFARADRLEAEAARARALLDRLESAILAKAFRGELVPQDPADEPASVLLDRIRAQRAAATLRPKLSRRGS